MENYAKPKGTIYIVKVAQCYEDAIIECIFDSYDKASEYARMLSKEYELPMSWNRGDRSEWIDIDEWNLYDEISLEKQFKDKYKNGQRITFDSKLLDDEDEKIILTGRVVEFDEDDDTMEVNVNGNTFYITENQVVEDE